MVFAHAAIVPVRSIGTWVGCRVNQESIPEGWVAPDARITVRKLRSMRVPKQA
jgi:hypothetical protein